MENLFASQSSEVSPNIQSTGMRVTWVRKGHTPEADKLLEYLERGVFDALDKRYLKTFIFAIYLDKDQPTNIVEAYTFNFSYVTIPGTDLTIPIMSLGNQMSQLSLRNNSANIDLERPTTLGEAKRSIKQLLKRLMLAVQQFDNLPSRRFATFKIFYTEDTPEEYEPPGFHAGDYEKDKFVFKTHSDSEEPEVHRIGIAHSGHHSQVPFNQSQPESRVVQLASNENQDAIYAGVTPSSRDLECIHTPEVAEVDRANEVEIQKTDAERRNTIWLAEGPLSGVKAHTSIDDADGELNPEFSSQTLEMHWSPKPASSTLEPTQVVDTQMAAGGSENETLGMSRGINTMDIHEALLVKCAPANRVHEIEISPSQNDSIDSFSQEPSNQQSIHRQNTYSVEGRERCECSCGVAEENDGIVFCEGGCEKWFHVWCMGYQNTDDDQLPSSFFCLECRLGRDAHFETLRTGYPMIHKVALAKYQELCLFRRSIKSVQQYTPKVFVDFKKVLGCETGVAAQMWKRLKSEGFITEVHSAAEISAKERTPKKSKRKTVTKRIYEMVPQTFQGEKMRIYFSPQSQTESRLIGLQKGEQKSDNNSAKKESTGGSGEHEISNYSQTQEDDARYNIKRKVSGDDSQVQGPAQKKNKISLAPGVDLEA